MDLKPLVPPEERKNQEPEATKVSAYGPLPEVSNACCAAQETSDGHTKILIQPNKAPAPPPYFHLACLACCFCWPVGYFAMIRAAMCKSAIAHNNLAAANTLSREARRTSLWAIGVGVFMGMIYATIILVYIYYFYKDERISREPEFNPLH